LLLQTTGGISKLLISKPPCPSNLIFSRLENHFSLRQLSTTFISQQQKNKKEKNPVSCFQETGMGPRVNFQCVFYHMGSCQNRNQKGKFPIPAYVRRQYTKHVGGQNRHKKNSRRLYIKTRAVCSHAHAHLREKSK
jgi:hypothetical protein